MAGFHIHIAIGKEYLKKNKIVDEKSFMRGIIDPDLGDKTITHYSGYQDKRYLFSYLANKVCLYQYLIHNDIDSDYQKGYFLHLITDYVFFTHFMDKNYLSHVSYEDFCKDLYYSYDMNNAYLEDKYDLSNFEFKEIIEKEIKKSRKEKNMMNETRLNLLENDKVDQFIMDIASLDLADYRDKILENKGNI